MSEYVHKTVLLHESINGLNLHDGSVYLDGTLGSGGHALMAQEKGARVIGLDRDEGALARSRERLNTDAILIHESYRNLDKVLADLNIPHVDAIMLDLGLSSDQFETSGRGFTFQKDEPLLMTFDEKAELTAREIVNTWDEENIADIIYGYGEERYARRIAKNIVASRPIDTTFQLVDVVKRSVPFHFGRLNPATKTFQALRITVNDEINTLKDGLKKGFEALSKNGRMAVISFHSLEDRVVKNYFRDRAKEETGFIHTKKPIVASDEERVRNPRSRSAKLRIIEKIV